MSMFCEPRAFPTPGCRYVAARAFTWRGGRKFAAGEAFDYAALGLSELEAQQLWTVTELEVAPAVAIKPALAKHQQQRR